MKRRELHPADVAFVLAVVIVAIVRYRILASGGAPPTIDAGDWLAHGDALFGLDIRSDTIVYPPLVPVLVKSAVAAFGLTAGVSVVGSFAAVAPALGLYAALRIAGVARSSIVPAALLLLGASAVGEAAAWGGFPQLIGFGIAPVVLVMVDRSVRSWSVGDSGRTGLLVAALAATSHFVTAVAAVATVVLLGIRLVERRLPGAKRMAACAAAFTLPVLWLLPLYFALLQAFGGVSRDFRFFNDIPWSGLWDQVEFLYRDLPIVWRPLLVAAVAAPMLFISARTTPLWRVTSASLASIVVAFASTHEGRFVYFITPWVGLAIALWAESGPDWLKRRFGSGATRTGVLAVITVVALIQIDSGLDFFQEQRGYYGLLTPDLVAGIEEVRDTTSSDAVLGVTSLNDAPLGRWVEAIADRETYYGSPLQWLLFEVDLERSTRANALFVPPFPTTERVAEAAGLGIDLILVPTRWVFYDEAAFAAFTAAHPNAVTVINDELVVIDPTAA